MANQLVNSMVASLCSAVRQDPCMISLNPRACQISPIGGIALQSIANSMCDNEPVPQPEFLGPPNQCVGELYYCTVNETATYLGGQHYDITQEWGPFIAPILSAGTRTVGNFKAGVVSTGGGEATVTSGYNRDLYPDFSWRLLSVRRANGSTTPCTYEPPIGFPQHMNPDRDPTTINEITLNATYNAGPSLSLTVPFGVMINRVNPSFQFKLADQLVFELNLGGIHFNPSIRPSVNAELPASTQVQIDSIDNSIETVNNTVNDISNIINNSVDCCDEVVEILRRIGSIQPLKELGDNICDSTTVTNPTSLFDAVSILQDTLVKLAQSNCPEQQQDPSTLLIGTSSRETNSYYISLPSGTCLVTVELIGELPASLTYNMGNEASGQFGAIAAAKQNYTGSQQFLYTRKSSLYVDRTLGYDSVRLYLKPGIQFVVKDTGLRL